MLRGARIGTPGGAGAGPRSDPGRGRAGRHPGGDPGEQLAQLAQLRLEPGKPGLQVRCLLLGPPSVREEPRREGRSDHAEQGIPTNIRAATFEGGQPGTC